MQATHTEKLFLTPMAQLAEVVAVEPNMDLEDLEDLLTNHSPQMRQRHMEIRVDLPQPVAVMSQEPEVAVLLARVGP